MRLKILTALLCLSLLITARAQNTSTAAVLSVRYAPVEVKRAGTEAWIALTPGAEMPFGSGDALRTSKDSGRAALTFAGMQWIVLPNTEIMLDRYMALTVDEAFIEAHVTGVIVTTASPGGAWSYLLHTPAFEVTAPATRAALWTGPDWPDSYIVAEGRGVITRKDGESIEVNAGEGLYIGQQSDERPVVLEAPYNAARLQSTLFGCAAAVTTRDNVGLIVRRGPGTGHQNLDILLNGFEVSILGQTETSGWSRIQYLSGFSWMFTRALNKDATCTRVPPTFADDASQESIITVYNADDDEKALLAPFFGDPKENYLFYRTKAR